MPFQVTALIVLLAFYGCYYGKMIRQKKQGIQTDQIGKGKKGSARVIEITMKIATILVPITEVISIILHSSMLPTPVRCVGAVMAIFGVTVFICSVLTMRDSWRAGVSQTEKTELITDGVYQISRNPAFLGFDLVYVGILLMFFNRTLLAVSALAMLMFHLQIVYVEEPFLLTAFGDEYSNYQNHVNRYLGKKQGVKGDSIMSVSKPMRKRKMVIGIVSVLSVIAVIVGACAVYVNDYYHADLGAIAAFSPADAITKEVLDDGTIVYAPQNATAGFVFYPGGKVEHTAYTPLMQACAERGILCVLIEMPFRLAVLDVSAADGIAEQYPQIEDWYIGGHSLGGSMAASYLAEHTAEYEGLVLLGSYATADLSDTALKVLSMYGSEDTVLNSEKYAANKANLPDDFTEVVIDGGCHAYFGMYGAQDGDGTPTITNREQIVMTADAIAELINNE